eukprot:scaffold7253_cov385-Prasinococcus_capsulatus_cf.AAC.1
MGYSCAVQLLGRPINWTTFLSAQRSRFRTFTIGASRAIRASDAAISVPASAAGCLAGPYNGGRARPSLSLSRLRDGGDAGPARRPPPARQERLRAERNAHLPRRADARSSASASPSLPAVRGPGSSLIPSASS